MFYQITGELLLTEVSAAVLDCGGVGYYVNISSNTLQKIAGKRGERVRLFTYLKVSEDALDLYGFYEYEELQIFKLLISVSGVGAKSALSILSGLTLAELTLAVSTGDAKAIARANGVGSKTAARIILELKDKLGGAVSEVSVSDLSAGVAAVSTSAFDDAVSTLMALGYTRAEAQVSLKGVSPDASLDEMVKYALKKLSSGRA